MDNSISNNFHGDKNPTDIEERIIDFSNNAENCVQTVKIGGNTNSSKYDTTPTIQMCSDYYSPEKDSNTSHIRPNTDPLFGMILSESTNIRTFKIYNKLDCIKFDKKGNSSLNENENVEESYRGVDVVRESGTVMSNNEKEKENKMMSSTQFEEIRF